MVENYTLVVVKNNSKTKIAVEANDNGHAQAQAIDIVRALDADKYDISYGRYKDTAVSRLFRDLAFNNFSHQECYGWTKNSTNDVPCCYVVGERYYLRGLILKYLDIPKDDFVTKNSCKCKNCINPYHFEYVREKNEKLSGGDERLLVAYRSQGVEVIQIARALNVHRSTIYRRLKDEPVPARIKSHG
jgi:hypothetical protein